MAETFQDEPLEEEVEVMDDDYDEEEIIEEEIIEYDEDGNEIISAPEEVAETIVEGPEGMEESSAGGSFRARNINQQDEVPDLSPMPPSQSPSNLAPVPAPAPMPYASPVPAPAPGPAPARRPSSITNEADVQYIAYLQARFKLTDMEILRVLSLTNDAIGESQFSEGMFHDEYDEEVEIEEEEDGEEGEGDSFVEETLSTPMVPPPPSAGGGGGSQDSGDGSVPSGPEFKTKPIPSMGGAPASAFDREATMIRPVGEAPSPVDEDAPPPPMDMPIEWYDDNLPKTPVIDNTESKADIEEEEEEEEELEVNKMENRSWTAPYVPPQSSDQGPVVDLEHGPGDDDEQQQRPKDQQQLLREVYQEREVIYASPRGTRKNRGDGVCLAGFICCIFLLLSAFAIYLLIAMVSDDVPPFDSNDSRDSRDSRDDGTVGVPLPPPVAPTFAPALPPTPFDFRQPTTPLSPYVPGECGDLSSQLQPHVLSQCECNGAITVLENNVQDRYEALRQQFIPRIYSNWDHSIGSCDPANQALVWLSTVTPRDETDLLQRYVLAKFYYQNRGVQWRSQGMWLDNVDVCLWYGVACTDQQMVALLSLDDNNISGPIPWELGLLQSLRNLGLDRNSLTGTIPGEIFIVPSLQGVSVSMNRLKGNIPKEIRASTNLNSLRVDNNLLAGSIESELGRAVALVNLDLSFNEFAGLVPAELGDLSLLESFRIEGNPQLTGRIPSEVCDLRSESLMAFTIDCPTRDLAPICPIPSCCTSCVRQEA